jgi:hypothetical protein
MMLRVRAYPVRGKGEAHLTRSKDSLPVVMSPFRPKDADTGPVERRPQCNPAVFPVTPTSSS